MSSCSLGREDSIKGKAEVNANPCESESMSSIEHEVLDQVNIDISLLDASKNNETSQRGMDFTKREFDTYRNDETSRALNLTKRDEVAIAPKEMLNK